jgi:hypothetical protein
MTDWSKQAHSTIGKWSPSVFRSSPPRNSGVNHAMHRKVEKWLEAAQLQEV